MTTPTLIKSSSRYRQSTHCSVPNTPLLSASSGMSKKPGLYMYLPGQTQIGFTAISRAAAGMVMTGFGLGRCSGDINEREFNGHHPKLAQGGIGPYAANLFS
ncbi:PREDICTED: uncharacterized protein LOC108367040 [Rhagoletis zephyria]|uniref:uncharacterized protein LOC108367040 n=1 Tax=Rhagoletis zephyria TaxID=28612 RepID=UPI0008118212|nr:PREDICTED: uncharacterized protein LOC108367040 [Rhagoletis zephyria]